jgi:hypothetical protein
MYVKRILFLECYLQPKYHKEHAVPSPDSRGPARGLKEAIFFEIKNKEMDALG